jgi:hypothetical protein
MVVLVFSCFYLIKKSTASIYIPVGFNQNGAPYCNFTLSGTRLQNLTRPMTLKFLEGTNAGTTPCTHSLLELHVRNNVKWTLRDPSVFFGGPFAPESSLAVKRGSWIRNNFGPIAYTGNELVLNSSRSEFLQTCALGSNVSVDVFEDGLDDSFAGGVRLQDSRFHQQGVSFRLRSLQGGVIGSVPNEIMQHIELELSRMGAIVAVTGRPQPRTIASSCNSTLLASLPNLVYEVGSSGQIVLSPYDYIKAVPERNVCVFQIAKPAPRGAGGYYFLNPLMIPGLNFRISNDLLEICDSSAI